MRHDIVPLTAAATVLGGLLLLSSGNSVTGGDPISDAEASHIVGGCIGASSVMCLPAGGCPAVLIYYSDAQGLPGYGPYDRQDQYCGNIFGSGVCTWAYANQRPCGSD